MEDKSFDSLNSSISSRKTSNFFPKSAISTPNLNTYSTPMTPIINHNPSGVNFNQLNQALNNLPNLSNSSVSHQPTPKSFSSGYGGGGGGGSFNGNGMSSSTYSSHTNHSNHSNYSLVSNPGANSNPSFNYGNGSLGNGYGSNQSTPIFNDFEFEVKSPDKRASSFNDIWKKPLDDFNFPLESTFESTLELGRELEKSYLDLNSNLSSTLNFVLEESDLAPDQLPDSNIYKKKSRSYSSNHNYVYNGQNYSPELFPLSVPQSNYHTSTQSSFQSMNSASSQSSYPINSLGHLGPAIVGNGSAGSGNSGAGPQGSFSSPNPATYGNQGYGYSYSNQRTSISSVHTTSSVHSIGPVDSIDSVNGFEMSTNPLSFENDEILIKLPRSKPLAQPTLNIQKFNESFSSTFYKRNKNGYMYIKESNDDLIKLDDYFFKIDIKLRRDKTSLTVDVNDIIGSEFINDFKIVKKKPMKKYD
ncbi:hypothetical protein CLIB1444_06S02300 [[Candida] jaroonii]|uniref:Uncharacterized protein n=1 Tax=[Candida] jaroonii TaxID=467808 RepID=A0ACA9Y8U7_9ASCO|nr:hypothetical protein CLIB1444_06S02300 [[Candida] jaroonii]